MKFGIVSKVIRWALALFFSSTILAVVAYRFIPVYITPLMVIRCFQQMADGQTIRMHHHWVSLDDVSPHLPVAVMASEDQRFLIHHVSTSMPLSMPLVIIARAKAERWEQAQYLSKPPRMYFYGQAVVGQERALRFISQPL